MDAEQGLPRKRIRGKRPEPEIETELMRKLLEESGADRGSLLKGLGLLGTEKQKLAAAQRRCPLRFIAWSCWQQKPRGVPDRLYSSF